MPRGTAFFHTTGEKSGLAAALSWEARLLKPEHLPPGLQAFVESHPLLVFLVLLVAAVLVTVLSDLRKDRENRPNAATLNPVLRTELLVQLAQRIRRRLEDNLGLVRRAHIHLGLQDMPDAVRPGWQQMHLQQAAERRNIPRGKTILELFDEQGGRLLILGVPGGGKTTLLLDLAQQLIQRAQRDAREPIPVVLNLASWARQALSLREWLAGELPDATPVSRALAREMADGHDLLLLLDGLDEVHKASRAACVDAINEYLREPCRMVICSRSAEYRQAAHQLQLESAVEIEPLTYVQICETLSQIATAAKIRNVLDTDTLLRELVQTPLILSVLVLAYGGQSTPVSTADTLEVRGTQLFDAYVRRMLTRRPLEGQTHRQIVRWLQWLALKMQTENMTDFVVDYLQPTWLKHPTVYRWAIVLLSALTWGLSLGLWSALEAQVSGLLAAMFAGITFGPSVVTVFVFMFVLVEVIQGEGDGLHIHLKERLYWSWSKDIERRRRMLKSMPVIELLAVFAGGFVSVALRNIQLPGQRVLASARNGLFFAVFLGLVFGLVFFGIVAWFVGGLVTQLYGGLVAGLHAGLFMLFFFLVPGFLFYGGGGALQHYVLRALLTREGVIPRRYVEFLLTASDILLLQHDSGIVRFRHLLLRDYFADLTPERIEGLATGEQPL